MHPHLVMHALILSGVPSALAHPLLDPRLEDMQCRCLSTTTNTKPTPCTYMESHRLAWHTANTLATDYNLPIAFASRDTVASILAIRRPLPSSVLRAIGEAESPSERDAMHMPRANRIVCAFGDEVNMLGKYDGSMEHESHFVGYILACLMLLTVIYVVAEYAWSR